MIKCELIDGYLALMLSPTIMSQKFRVSAYSQTRLNMVLNGQLTDPLNTQINNLHKANCYVTSQFPQSNKQIIQSI